MLGAHEARAPDGGHQQVRLAGDGDEVAGLGVADGHRGVRVEEEQGHGLAHDVAPPHDDRALAGDGDALSTQQLHDPRRRAGHEARPLLHEQPDVLGMETVDVLRGIDEAQYLFGVDRGRQRELDEDAVDLRAAVVVVDLRHHLQGGGRSRQRRRLVIQAQLLAGPGLAPNVDGRSGIVADEQHAETGPHAAGGEGGHVRPELVLDRPRGGRAVERPGAAHVRR